MKNWIIPAALIGIVSWLWLKSKKTQAATLPGPVIPSGPSGSGTLPVTPATEPGPEYTLVESVLDETQTWVFNNNLQSSLDSGEWIIATTIVPTSIPVEKPPLSREMDSYAQIIASKPGTATVWTFEELQQVVTNPSYTKFFVPYKISSATLTAMALAIIEARGNNAPSLLMQQWPGYVTTFDLTNVVEASQYWGKTVKQWLEEAAWW